ncbi:MAG: hypothetical protein RLZZ621_1834 [Gemmatimonadota bacterium]
MRWQRAILRMLMVACTAVLSLGTPASAQVDPRGPMRTIVTPHFRVHHARGLDSLGRRVAEHAERAYAQLAAELARPSGVIDLLLADNVDASNGFAQVFPSNRIVVYAVPPLQLRELRFHDDWLRLVITHELAHVFHLDRSRGLYRMGRALFGRNPLFFPNAMLPSWVKEGLAVHYESALTGSGRLVGTEFAAQARAAAVDSAIPPMGRWSLASSRFPRGQTAYAWGSMTLDRATQSDSAMRRFVDGTAAQLPPVRLSRISRRAFGRSLEAVFGEHQATLLRGARGDESDADSLWTMVSADGFYAAAPRWVGNDQLVWSASNGREIAGLYTASRTEGRFDDPVRVAWRNSLDANVPVGVGTSGAVPMVFAQVERADPFVSRSDLWRRAIDGRETRLTDGARLVLPDVRADGEIIAVQLQAGTSRLVRVSPDGQRVAPLSTTGQVTDERWSDPRWAPDGRAIAAVQLLPSGESRVVVLDTVGTLRAVVAGALGVFASPSFTPDGARLVWSSDRSGRMQLETAVIASLVRAGDTTSWRGNASRGLRDAAAIPRQASRVSTSVYEPSVSPDGREVAALVLRGDGWHVIVTPLDTTGPVAGGAWYASQRTRVVADRPFDESITIDTASWRRTNYRAARQLRPTYWLPLAGVGRDDRATLGAGTSGVDILGRHAWSASALLEPERRELDASAAYRYAGLGVPVFDASWSQQWDGSFRVVDDSARTIGFVGRRRRFVSLATTWSVPRVRWAAQGTVGAQYERRAFAADVDSVLGPANSLLRRGTGFPSLFVNASWSTARLALQGISVEEGVTLSTNTTYRWRDAAPSNGSWRTVWTVRGYRPFAMGGFARHVLAVRGSVGLADRRTVTEFAAGGVSGTQGALLPGVTVGDPVRTFSVRGVPAASQRGSRALGGTVEYRLPLVQLRKLPSPFGVYTDRLSAAFFTDAARAWCPADLARTNRVICERPGVRDGWLASAGAELLVDLALQYDQPYRLRLGVAQPYAAPIEIARRPRVYITLGGYF